MTALLGVSEQASYALEVPGNQGFGAKRGRTSKPADTLAIYVRGIRLLLIVHFRSIDTRGPNLAPVSDRAGVIATIAMTLGDTAGEPMLRDILAQRSWQRGDLE